MDRLLTIPNNLFHEGVKSGLENYLFHGIPPGRYMTCLLSNDLYGMVGSADHWNRKLVLEQAQWVVLNLPWASYGTPEIMEDWMKDKGGRRSSWAEEQETQKMWNILQGKEEKVHNEPPF